MERYINRTREDVIAAFQRAIERKRKWEEDSRLEFARLRANQMMVEA